VAAQEKKEESSQVRRRFWRGLVWKVRAWVVQEGRWGYGEHSPKIWCGGVDCEVRRTKCSEGHRNGKPQIRQKEELEKKIKKLVRLVLARFDH
jgi:hypothetical protein